MYKYRVEIILLKYPTPQKSFLLEPNTESIVSMTSFGCPDKDVAVIMVPLWVERLCKILGFKRLGLMW